MKSLEARGRGNPTFGPDNPDKFPQSESDRDPCSKAIYVRLTEEVYDLLRDKATDLGLPISTLARRIIEKSL